jgi:hypothetical protein
MPLGIVAGTFIFVIFQTSFIDRQLLMPFGPLVTIASFWPFLVFALATRDRKRA